MKHGAILVSGGRLIAYGCNRNILNPYYYPDADKLSIHAEEAAIRSIRGNVSRRRYTLYVVRVGKHGVTTSAPCLNCRTLIDEFGAIKRIVHT